jgi:hypothetical protein
VRAGSDATDCQAGGRGGQGRGGTQALTDSRESRGHVNLLLNVSRITTIATLMMRFADALRRLNRRAAN